MAAKEGAALVQLIELEGVAVVDGEDVIPWADSLASRAAWVVAPGYAPATLGLVECRTYDVEMDRACSQIVRVCEGDGRPIVGLTVALSEMSFDAESAKVTKDPSRDIEAERDIAELLGTVAAEHRGLPVHLAVTDRSGAAVFRCIRSGTYWVDYNRGHLPFVRGGHANPYLVEVPSSPVDAHLLPLGVVLVEFVGDSCLAVHLDRRARESVFVRYDYEDAVFVRDAERAIQSRWPKAHAVVGPIRDSTQRGDARLAIAWRSSGWQEAMVPVHRVDEGTSPVVLYHQASASDLSCLVKFVVVDARGDVVSELSGTAFELEDSLGRVLTAKIGDEVRVPRGTIRWACPGLPEGMLAGRVIECQGDRVIDVAVGEAWRRYSLRVHRSGTETVGFGLSFTVGRQRFTRGIVGDRCSIWSDHPSMNVTLRHRGSKAVDSTLDWDRGDPTSPRERLFRVEIE